MVAINKIETNEELPLIGGKNIRLAVDEPSTRPVEESPVGVVLVNTRRMVVVGKEDSGKIEVHIR